MPWGTYSLIIHKHFFSKHALLVVVDMKVGVKEASKNLNHGLDRFGNDKCTSAWGIKGYVCSHTGSMFPLAMVEYNNGAKMC